MNRLLLINRRATIQLLEFGKRCPTQTRLFCKGVDEALVNQTCQLPDGRTIGFAEFGKPGGTPAFFFHGGPGSRYDGIEYHETAKKLNVRIISPDRPGHGLSTLYPGRKLLDYPQDISSLAKHLKIPQYYVFGQSGGGPFSVVCAYLLPQTELLGASVVAGMGHPSQVNRKEAGLYTTMAIGMHKWLPRFTRALMAYSYRPSKLQDDEKMTRMFKSMFKYLRPHDRKEMEAPEVMPILLATVRQAFRQGPDGAISDVMIYGSDWGFELSDVRAKVKLFYGLDDNRTPPVFGRYFKKHLQNAELTEYEGATHFKMYPHYEEILTKVVGRDWSPGEGDKHGPVSKDQGSKRVV